MIHELTINGSEGQCVCGTFNYRPTSPKTRDEIERAFAAHVKWCDVGEALRFMIAHGNRIAWNDPELDAEILGKILTAVNERLMWTDCLTETYYR